MRVCEQRRGYFCGTHKGCLITITRDHDIPERHFYITVRDANGGGGYLYDGYSPEGVTTIAQAKREALYGSYLKPRPEPQTQRVQSSMEGK